MKKIIFLITISLLNTISATPAQNVAVFCSADDKANNQFKLLAYNLGTLLAQNNLGLVTGGSRTGLMKEVIDGYASQTNDLSKLFGVLSEALASYNVHHLTIPSANLKWSGTIHSRLSDFHGMTDTIIILPGGYGTLHELMDFLVHNQFGLHKTQIMLVNINGFWDHLLALFNHMAQEKLLALKHLEQIMIVQSPEQCVLKILNQESNTPQHALNTHYWEQK